VNTTSDGSEAGYYLLNTLDQIQIAGAGMTECVTQYFRCSTHHVRLFLKDPVTVTGGYGGDAGNGSGGLSRSQLDVLENAFRETVIEDGCAVLPFDVSRIVDSLRHEQYEEALPEKSAIRSATNWAYYALRPFLPVAVRRHLQHLYLSRWHRRSFPRWPVDCTVDHLLGQALLQSMKAAGVKRVPFIWFWPEGAPSCAIMTHDVETRAGRDFCGTLMDVDESFGIKSSFQVVPEKRYEVADDFLKSITSRGFELGVQDLNHDGRLYRSRQEFVARAAKINSYGHKWGVGGFRAAVLYRKQEWFDALDFAYDMSVPNVAHLDPQRGGCCTVMPYFVSKLLELPVTATQDYTLFHILRDYSIDLWTRQIALIMENNGLISFIVHPDYVMETRERRIYEGLLAYLSQLRENAGIWITTPAEVNRWWRQRAEMEIVESRDGLRITGPGSERARIAYASDGGGRIAFTLEDVPCLHGGGLQYKTGAPFA